MPSPVRAYGTPEDRRGKRHTTRNAEEMKTRLDEGLAPELDEHVAKHADGGAAVDVDRVVVHGEVADAAEHHDAREEPAVRHAGGAFEAQGSKPPSVLPLGVGLLGFCRSTLRQRRAPTT